MIGKYLKKYEGEIKKSIEDLKHKDTFYKQIPNLLTFIRLVCAIPAGLLYYVNPVASISLIAFLWATDAIDGKIARKLEIQSKLGADMDTVADKIMFLASSIPLLSSIPFLTLNLLLEAAIASINMAGRMKGLNTKTVFSGKLKTVSLAITLVYGYLYKFLGMPNIIKIVLLGVTSFLQTLAINDYVEQYEKLNKESKNNLDNIENNPEDTENKMLVKDETASKIEELKKIKSLVLASQMPNKVYSGKKRVRLMMQSKKNN